MSLLRLLGIAGVLAAGALVAGCNRDIKEADGIQTLHPSGLSHRTNEKYSLMAMFLDGTHALLTSSLFDIDKLFLADLKAGTVKIISIPKQSFFRFLPVHNGVLVESGGVTPSDTLLVDAQGNIKKLQLLAVAVTTTGNYDRIEAQRSRLKTLLDGGELDELTHLRIRYNTPNIVGMRTLTNGFYNDRHFIAINYANERDLPLLESKSVRTHTIDGTADDKPFYSGLDIEVKRNAFQAHAGIIDNRNITNIRISKNGGAPHDFPLKGFYYETVVVGDRLYIIGEGIRYIELKNL